ncbi:hypothetical protein MKX03_026147 [Papaver bracteatum]|nr:hypothetical protein MKX03_026147 [Papaver bracteatum]
MADNDHQDPRAKKARGKGKLGFLNELKDGDKVQVELYRGCPTGVTRKHLGHYIGFLAKDGHMFPLSVSNWKYMAPARIQAAMQEIKALEATKEDFEMATKIVSELETQFSTLIKLMMSREQLQPNPNGEGLDQVLCIITLVIVPNKLKWLSLLHNKFGTAGFLGCYGMELMM